MDSLSLQDVAAPELVTLPVELLQIIAACLRTSVCLEASAIPRLAATCKVLRTALVSELAHAKVRTLCLRSFLSKVKFHTKDMGGIFWRRPMVDAVFHGTTLCEGGYEFSSEKHNNWATRGYGGGPNSQHANLVPYKIACAGPHGGALTPSELHYHSRPDLTASELHYGILGWPAPSGTPAMFMQEDEDVIVGALTQIDFVDHPNLGVEGMRALAALDRIGLIDSLTLQNCGITDDAVRALIDAFKNANRARLQGLRLGGNPFGDDGLTTIVSAATKFPSLRVLQLGDTEVGDAGVAALAEAIDQGWLASGQQIWLAGTRVTQAGKQRLQAATSHLPIALRW